MHCFLFAVIVLASFLSVPVTGFAQPSCGQSITENTILTADLDCPPHITPAITIGASDVTLDLGGYSLRGQTISPGDTKGIFANNVERISITNGTIEGFAEAVFMLGTKNITISNVTIKNMQIDDPRHYISGIHLQETHSAAVVNSKFEFPNVYHKDAVILYASDAVIRNIESTGGAVSLSYHPECDNVSAPNIGEVYDSTFTDVPIGIEIMCTCRARIVGNSFSNNQNSIQGDAPLATQSSSCERDQP